MASPNSNSDSHELHAFADFALSHDMKSPDQILGQNSGTNASKPTDTIISTRVTEKKQKAKLRKKQPVEEEDGEPSPKRFSFSLTKEEIEQDLLTITGKRPLRCQKKRTKKEKNDLDLLLPGSSLDGHTIESLRKSYGSFSSKRF